MKSWIERVVDWIDHYDEPTRFLIDMIIAFGILVICEAILYGMLLLVGAI